MSIKVTVIGLGYVGLPIAIAAQTVGHDVTGIDINVSLVNSLNNGKSSVEDVSDEELLKSISLGFVAKSNFDHLKDAQVIIICVPTPLTQQGLPDLSSIEFAAESIEKRLSKKQLNILESTTYPGTTSEFLLTKSKVVLL